ncbi:alpha/beta fold hydrolase [Ectothiorhodospira marina]|uniref:Pimeloyl-ACP methyl ester carboxylesterase n=1 Tax=Ectothiorhodospira marina TaxID=1396821 RepID=A0A1H7LY50_9GAMM|nr:alpha/beta hydrolase [Ectothiorhodospira marina]SEL03237.1 Pimeloyl-ACP methyl ester carboxylesterase [Ectothiorhodospira marina]
MLRWLLIILGSLLTLGLLALLLGPFLISNQPLKGLESVEAVATEESRFVTIPFAGTDGLTLHYLESDGGGGVDAPTFVLLHGFTFNAYTWNELLPGLAEQGRVVAHDQVPYGLSAKPTREDWSGPNPFTKEAALMHLLTFLDAQGIDQAILVGNSSGATLAMEAALQAPERVKGLVLINPWVYVDRPTFPETVTQLPQIQRLNLLLARQMGARGALLDLSYHDPERISDERRALTTIHTRVENWDLAWGELFVRAMASPVDVSTHLGDLTQRSLVIISEEDRVVSPADSRRAAAGLPNATVATIPECGHVPQEECPDAVLDALLEWL